MDAIAIVNHWLHTGGRSLTPHQFDVLLNAFAKCSVPLFLKVTCDITITTLLPPSPFFPAGLSHQLSAKLEWCCCLTQHQVDVFTNAFAK